MCLCVGIEALVVLRDVCGMEAKEVEEVARRAAFALHEHPALYLPPRLLKLGLLAAVGDHERRDNGAYAHDGPLLPRLVERTARNFQMGSVMADKAYSSRRNLQVVSDNGATPYIPFRQGFKAGNDASTMWSRLWTFYHLNREEFLARYHLRSNVESAFSSIKAKFGERLRSKTETAQTNEVLLKVLCHNICCVIRSSTNSG